MAAPREIVDGLEVILDVFLSNIRNKERVAFILCDNLVELACKTRAHQRNHRFDRHCGFHAAWSAPGVQLSRNGLGGRVQNRRDTRNTMQHGNAGVTVTLEHCADAILDTRMAIDRLWRNSTGRMLRPHYGCALRIVSLYSSGGDARTQVSFEDGMRQVGWRGMADDRNPRISEILIEPGIRSNWYFAIHQSAQLVDQLLDVVLQGPPAD